MTPEEKIQKVLDTIFTYGGIDGGHHKQWLIDKTVRILTGTAKEYSEWIDKYNNGEDGPDTYSWDQGTPP